MRLLRLPVMALAAVVAGPAFAACPIELATYRDVADRAAVEFRPTGEGATITNSFRLLMKDGPVFDGIVMWTDGESRPIGQVSYQCPDGDVTGAEIEACTAWQGIIYAIDAAGTVSLLPNEGADAPASLILSGLGPDMAVAPTYSTAGMTAVPGDVFTLSGCQE